MTVLVVFDSAFGNTEKVARAIGEGLATTQVLVRHVDQVTSDDFEDLDLLIVGSPTQRFNSTPSINTFLKNIPSGNLENVRVAAFDTRFTEEKIGEIKILEFFVNIFGYAAKPMLRELQKKGGDPISPPQGFYVADTEGPLLDNEIERAREWGKQLL